MKRLSLKEKIIPAFLWVLTFAWLGLCYQLSSQNGTETGLVSLGVSQFIIQLLDLPQNTLHVLNANLRTAAHIIVFFVLTLLGGLASGTSTGKHRSAPLWPFVPCALFAVLDEVRKASIPGRHCSYPEAMLNVVGCALGCGAAYLICVAYRRIFADNHNTREK